MKVAGGKTALLLDQIANGWAILLNIQHRIAMVPGIERNVIDRLRTVADHFEDLAFLQGGIASRVATAGYGQGSPTISRR
jgi:hypothetical protein